MRPRTHGCERDSGISRDRRYESGQRLGASRWRAAVGGARVGSRRLAARHFPGGRPTGAGAGLHLGGGACGLRRRACPGGPNVFLDCRSRGSLGASGSLESWASGTLFERVKIDGAALRLTHEMARRQGGGWTAANSVIWNCAAKGLEAKGPEGAPNVVSHATEPLYEAKSQGAGQGTDGAQRSPRPLTLKVAVF